MRQAQPHLDKLESLLGTISGLAGIIQDDLCLKASDVEAPGLGGHDIGHLLTAIDELTDRGYHALDAVDKALDSQEAAR